MQVKTQTLGTVEVPDSRIINFTEGLFGFEQYHKYALIDSEYKPFIWMQSVESEDLAFLLVDPFLVCSDYEIDVDDKELLKINIKKPADVIVMVIVTILNNISVTANLMGPIVINKKSLECLQCILADSRWTTKYNIIDNIKGKEKKTC